MNNEQRQVDHQWHVAINRFHDGVRERKEEWRPWMYEAKRAWAEVPRLALLHALERKGELPGSHRQCSRSPSESVPDNHLTCCLGVECRKCPELAAIDQATLTPEQKDEAKAWTCAVHILTKGGDRMGEGYILTTDDRMYWDRVYSNLAQTECPREGGGQ